MCGLNMKLKEWGVMGGSYYIEFIYSKNNWNCYMYFILVGFENDWDVFFKDCVRWIEWNDDLMMKF